MFDFSIDELKGNVADLFTSDAKQKILGAIPPDRVVPGIVEKPITAGNGYYQIVLAQMYVRRDRVIRRTYYPAVQSIAKFDFGNDSKEVRTVISPLNESGDGMPDADHITVRDQHLTPLIPFNGGSISLDMTLYAKKGGDGFEQFTIAMQEFSKVVTAAPISSITNTLAPINAGISALFDLDRDKMVAGFKQSFQSESRPLVPQYMVSINDTVDAIDVSQLYAINSQLRWGRIGDIDDAVPFDSTDFLLVRVETTRLRDDWRNIGNIETLAGEAISGVAAKGKGDSTEVEDGKIRAAILEAWTSPDLSEEQRPWVGTILKETYMRAKGTPVSSPRINPKRGISALAAVTGLDAPPADVPLPEAPVSVNS